MFTEEGLEAPLDVIARRAGVGNATLYTAISPTAPRSWTPLGRLAGGHDGRRGTGQERRGRVGGSPAAYLDSVFETPGRHDRGTSDLMTTHLQGVDSLESVREHNRRTVDSLLARCHDEGTVRADVTTEDVPVRARGTGPCRPALTSRDRAGRLARPPGPAPRRPAHPAPLPPPLPARAHRRRTRRRPAGDGPAPHARWRRRGRRVRGGWLSPGRRAPGPPSPVPPAGGPPSPRMTRWRLQVLRRRPLLLLHRAGLGVEDAGRLPAERVSSGSLLAARNGNDDDENDRGAPLSPNTARPCGRTVRARARARMESTAKSAAARDRAGPEARGARG